MSEYTNPYLIPPPVPARYEGAKWEDVPEEIKKLFEEVPSTRRGIYIWGGVGTGKTHIAYALYRNAVAKARILTKKAKSWSGEEDSFDIERPKFWNTTELFREIRLDFDRKEYKKRTEEELMTHRGILFIDDIGSEKLSDWVMETFYLVINKRYNDNLPVVFTSNYNIEELGNRIGERIASRIVETCHIFELTGDDRRMMSAKKSVI